jgi:hypothetical protein
MAVTQRNVTSEDYLSKALVTPTGGSKKTLGDALAAPLTAIRPLNRGTGAYYLPYTCGARGTATVPLNGGKISLMPVWAPGMTISALWLDVATAATNSIRVGVYTNDPASGLPGSLLLDAGEIDISVADTREVAANLTLPNDWVWTAGISENTSGSLYVYGSSGTNTQIFDGIPGSAATAQCFRNTWAPRGLFIGQSYGALPRSLSGTSLIWGLSSVFPVGIKLG